MPGQTHQPGWQANGTATGDSKWESHGKWLLT